jgi:hypothetical protein
MHKRLLSGVAAIALATGVVACGSPKTDVLTTGSAGGKNVSVNDVLQAGLQQGTLLDLTFSPDAMPRS